MSLRREDLELGLVLYTAAQVRELDRLAIAGGIAGFELMRRAGQTAFTSLQQRWPDRSPIEVFCGGGNNGGDGYVVAALAAEASLPVKVWALADPASLSGDAALAMEWAVEAGVAIQQWRGEAPNKAGLVVDALLGTGLKGSVREKYAQAISAINASGVLVLALDVPSGLCSDSGRKLGAAIKASATISFIGRKRGMYTLEGIDCAGEKLFDDLAVSREVYRQLDANVFDKTRQLDCAAMLARWGVRPRNAHKGSFGHVLVIGGDVGMAGACLLAATAAARSGAGLVSCITRPEHSSMFVAARPELMVHGLSDEHIAIDGAAMGLISKASVVVIGPGLGQGGWGRALLSAVLSTDLPLIIDADALNMVALAPEILNSHRGPRILTPHPGEAARLLNCSTADIQADRFSSVIMLRDKYHATVLLKGAGTLIASADGASPIYLNSGGNPGMATGGMGDVLAGITAAFVAQGHEPTAATCLAAAVHSAAADRAAQHGERGMLASDVIDNLRGVINGYAAVS